MRGSIDSDSSVLPYLNKLHEVSGMIHIINLDHFFFLDEEDSEEDDDDDDEDEEESTEESTKMEVDSKQKQKKTEETPKTAVRNIQTLNFLSFNRTYLGMSGLFYFKRRQINFVSSPQLNVVKYMYWRAIQAEVKLTLFRFSCVISGGFSSIHVNKV